MARVLVADDEAAIRDVIRSTCELDGHEALTVGTSDEAVASYVSFAPALMILDLNMPGGGAETILSRVEAESGAPSCPAIVVTGATPPEGDPARHPQIREMLQKPFNIDALRIAVKTVLSEPTDASE